MAVSIQIWSPGRCGAIPCRAASVQDRPSVLVQMASGAAVPMATHPFGPPASRVAAYPSGGWPPPGRRTGASRHDAPPSAEAKNCWRTTPSLTCAPVVKIVLPQAAIRLMVWNTPRPCSPG